MPQQVPVSLSTVSPAAVSHARTRRAHTCRPCGNKLQPNRGSGRNRRFCSEKCKQKAYRERVKRNGKNAKKALRNALIRFSQNSVEWYTPPAFIAAVKAVFGAIELDPASSQAANAIVQATRYFDSKTDGLVQDWKAETVFLNPPYCKQGNVSRQALWTHKLIAAYEHGDIQQAILLVNAATDTKWFTPLYNYPLCFVTGRIRFTTATGGKSNGHTVGSVFAYLGPHPQKFMTVFQQFGIIMGTFPGQTPDTAGKAIHNTPQTSQDKQHPRFVR